MSDAIRVGLVGYGYASKTFHAPLISGTPGLALTTVSTVSYTHLLLQRDHKALRQGNLAQRGAV